MRFLFNIYRSSCFWKGVEIDYMRIFYQGSRKAKRPEKLYED